jgi:NAD(P)-dependent dehydrogenase (short-subunit alcohol dehydrogenase family)
VEFSDKIAVVTGAANGIGERTAQLLAERGASVAVVDFDGKRADTVAQAIVARGGKALAVSGDVSNSAQVKANVAQILEHFGQIDILVNNAGICISHAIVSATEEAWRRVIDVNLSGTFFWSQTVAVECMIPRKQGAIVNVASIAGLVAVPNVIAYTASKHGVVGLTKGFAVELGRSNIRVNALCPGVTDTAMMADAIRINPQMAADRIARIPLGHGATVDDQAEAILFMASPRANSVSGLIMNVDGGTVALSSGYSIKLAK